MSTSDVIIPEVTTNAESARVQLISAPIASPGHCAICGKNKHDKGFADPRLDFEFFGTLIICADCVGDFANLFGYLSPEQSILLARRIQYLEEQLQIHRDALLALESSVDDLTNYRMLRNAIIDVNSDASIPGPTIEASEINTETTSGTVVNFPTTTIESEPETSESSNEQGSDDVSSTTSSDSTIGIIDL